MPHQWHKMLSIRYTYRAAMQNIICWYNLLMCACVINIKVNGWELTNSPFTFEMDLFLEFTFWISRMSKLCKCIRLYFFFSSLHLYHEFIQTNEHASKANRHSFDDVDQWTVHDNPYIISKLMIPLRHLNKVQSYQSWSIETGARNKWIEWRGKKGLQSFWFFINFHSF